MHHSRLSLFCLLLACVPVFAQADERHSKSRPALVVLVSVDQWRYEYLERFATNLDDDCFIRRAQRDGVCLRNCFHQHAFTFTGPGHSVLMTGAYPNRSGIIGNSWYDRELEKDVYCVSDEDAQIIGTVADEDPVSPRKLLVDTLGDQLKMATYGKAKVFGVSIKDRAAILMAGRLANAAYWMSNEGLWITSDHYTDQIPGYLRNLSAPQAIQRFSGKSWELLNPAGTYLHGEQENSEHERPKFGMSKDFPHVMPSVGDEEFETNYVKNLACSPFGNQATLEAAREIVIHEKLGVDATPDILAINLASNDYVGHAFGPYSLEVEDMTYRTDAQLDAFARFLDSKLGDREWLMIVTADHGVAPIPERAAEWGLRGKRDPLGSLEGQQQKLELVLRQSMKINRKAKNLVQKLTSNQVFLNHAHPKLNGKNIELARRVARDFLLNHSYVAHAATREQLLQDCSGDEMLHMFQRSYHAKRSGDVVFAMKPYTFAGSSGTTHGSPWRYDRHVPLMILSSGNRIRLQGSPADQVSPASIAPTLAQLLRLEAPSACAERGISIDWDN